MTVLAKPSDKICQSGAILSALFCLAVLPACKPVSDKSALLSVKEESAREQSPPLALNRDAGHPAASPSAGEGGEPVASFVSIDQRYLAAGDVMTKVGLLGEIAALEDREAIHTLSHLFQSERETDLKVALLAAAMVQEDCAVPQYALYVSALWPVNASSVRHMAVEGLAVLRTPEAAAMLRALQFDPDLDIRSAAGAALQRAP